MLELSSFLPQWVQHCHLLTKGLSYIKILLNTQVQMVIYEVKRTDIESKNSQFISICKTFQSA